MKHFGRPKRLCKLVLYGTITCWQTAITGTGSDSIVPFLVLGSASSGTVICWSPYQNWTLWLCPISDTGLCQFRYGHSLGPIPELDSMRIVPIPVLGSASSGTVIRWTPYQNWTLCALSHFRYWALPVPVRSFFSHERRTAFLILDIVEGRFSGTKILDRGHWSVTEWAIKQEKEKN